MKSFLAGDVVFFREDNKWVTARVLSSVTVTHADTMVELELGVSKSASFPFRNRPAYTLWRMEDVEPGDVLCYNGPTGSGHQCYPELIVSGVERANGRVELRAGAFSFSSTTRDDWGWEYLAPVRIRRYPQKTMPPDTVPHEIKVGDYVESKKQAGGYDGALFRGWVARIDGILATIDDLDGKQYTLPIPDLELKAESLEAQAVRRKATEQHDMKLNAAPRPLAPKGAHPRQTELANGVEMVEAPPVRPLIDLDLTF